MVLVSDKPVNSIVLPGLLVMGMPFLHTGRKRHPLPGTEEPMITVGRGARPHSNVSPLLLDSGDLYSRVVREAQVIFKAIEK
jgi:hypothetical protein